MAAKKTLSKEALAVLASMETEGSAARFANYHQLGGPGQLDHKLYEECNKALEAIGGKWNRGKKAHLFAEDPRDALDRVVLTGGFTDAKQEFQFFETPAALADRIVEKCAIEPVHRILEPSAGRGAIADAVVRLPAFRSAVHRMILVELMPKNAAYLRAQGFSVVEKDFLEWKPDKPLDRIPEGVEEKEKPLCEVNDCDKDATPCECGNAHCADHPHVYLKGEQ